MIEQRKIKTQEPLERNLNKQTQTLSFNPRIKLDEGRKWLLPVTSYEATNSFFKVTDENNSFSLTLPGHWLTKSAEKTINEINKLLELRSQNSIELHLEQVRKKG